jgi:hypothetical protein
MDLTAAKSGVSDTITDGMCPCRGCKAARKRVVDDLKALISDNISLDIINTYWDTNK